MTLDVLQEAAKNKETFGTLQGFSDFANSYLDYISTNLQAVIVARNEINYRFYQYSEEGNFAITRPINSNLMLTSENFEIAKKNFFLSLKDVKSLKRAKKLRNNINNFVYTCQQCIGATLDSLPAGQSNSARKLNGDIFEHFIRLILEYIKVPVDSGIISLPVKRKNEILAEMKYQHDIILKNKEQIKAIGSIKTSSKDRLDKIFIDKLTYNMLAHNPVPHFAIFLNDVQRKGKERNYGINSTFLAGHFKAYTLCLNHLDGVYYCDLRPVMTKGGFFIKHIKTFDYFLIEDIWTLLK